MMRTADKCIITTAARDYIVLVGSRLPLAQRSFFEMLTTECFGEVAKASKWS